VKSVAIFRHAALDGPGYFSTYAINRGIAQTLIRVDAGEPVPADPTAYAGLVFMGGPMSVNDDLSWIGPIVTLIQRAVAQGVPVLGHCLGGQLLSKALGGRVTRNPVHEIGWGRVTVAANAQARRWFGDCAEFQSFHWHNETFSIPAGAALLASSAYCAHQAFAIGKHLGLQCHVEMEPAGIRAWLEESDTDLNALRGPSVQSAAEIAAGITQYNDTLSAVAQRLYDRWVEGLIR
jgi:GMP synthase-like glutamine amidotransferase